MNEKYFTSLEQIPQGIKGCILTIGNFDGVHLGHQMLIKTGRELSDKTDCPLVVMTFDPPPDVVARPYDKILRITPREEKVRLLFESGADYVVVLTATEKFLAMQPSEFENDVITEYFAPKHMVEGDDFCYGSKRAGNLKTLEQFAERANFKLHIVSEVDFHISGQPTRISSTKIRQLIQEGYFQVAAEMLGRPYELIGPIVGGEQVGRAWDIPTANIDPGEQVFPKHGVYAGWAKLDDKIFTAAISIGTKPTTGDKPLTIEANLLDATGNFYGKIIRLQFCEYIRGQAKFDSVEDLINQIHKDISKTRELCPPDSPEVTK